jgi:hypothetical protein
VAALAARLNAVPAPTVSDAAMRRLLSEAGLRPGTSVDTVDLGSTLGTATSGRPGDSTAETLAAAGSEGAGCLFVDLRADSVTAWPAPLLAPCTAARAEQAATAGRSGA